MKRRLFLGLSALSLLLGVAIVALWVRSRNSNEMLTSFATPTRLCAVTSYQGSIMVLATDNGFEQYPNSGTTVHQKLGFFYCITRSGPKTSRAILVPYWALLAFTLGLPAWQVLAWRYAARQSARRLRLNLCPTCAYDLRASKDRCPECGSPIPNSSHSSNDQVQSPL